MTIMKDPKVSYRVDGGWVDALTGVLTPDLGFPTVTSVGVDGLDGWTPTTTVTDDNINIVETGAVLEDVRVVNGTILVRAPHVTLRRCEVINGSFTNDYGFSVYNDCLYEDCTVRATPPGFNLPLNAAWGNAGFTCRRCSIIDTNEGWHTGASEASGFTLADPTHPDGFAVRLYDCFARITGPIDCSELGIDYHGDVLQCFDGSNGGVPLIIRNCAMYSIDDLPDCGASAIFGCGFPQSQPVDIDGLILSGAALTYHNDCGGSIRNLFIEQDKWVFFGVSVDEVGWSLCTRWEAWNAVIGPDGQVASLVARYPFGYPGFGPMDPP